MGRIIRVNELIQRDLSDQLHTVYKDQAVAITITEVKTSPDLREARVYYSVFGNQSVRKAASEFLRKHQNEIKMRMSKKVILKYLPKLIFVYHDSIERGCRVMDIIDQLDHESDDNE